MSDAHDAGVLSRATQRPFDRACLAPAPALAGDEIRALREREHVSQPVFAAYLNVSRNLVSDWERRVKRPGGPALRLLSIIQRKGIAGGGVMGVIGFSRGGEDHACRRPARASLRAKLRR
jgi:putative transcriptional regulator